MHAMEWLSGSVHVSTAVLGSYGSVVVDTCSLVSCRENLVNMLLLPALVSLLLPTLQPEVLGEVLEMMRGSAAVHGGAGGGAGSSIPLQVEQICRVMRQWGQSNGLL